MSDDKAAYQEYLTGDTSPLNKRDREQLKRAPTLWEYNAKQTDRKSSRPNSRSALIKSRNSSSRMSKIKTPKLKQHTADGQTESYEALMPARRILKKTSSQLGVRKPSIMMEIHTQSHGYQSPQKQLVPLNSLLNSKKQITSLEMLSSRPFSASIPSFKTGSESKSDLKDSKYQAGNVNKPVPTHFLMRYRNENCFSSRNRPSSTDHVGALKNIPSWEHRKATVFGRTFYEHFPNAPQVNYWVQNQKVMKQRIQIN